jgi:hypothetical protein
MDIFKEISEMKFGEAYNELASLAYEETKQFLSEKKAALQQSESGILADTERDIRDRLPFG